MDIIDASLSLIEQDKNMSEFLQTFLGKINKESLLYARLRETAREMFGEDPNDTDLKFVLHGMWHMDTMSRTVSFSRKISDGNYGSNDSFESRSINFQPVQQSLKDGIMSMISPEEDVTEKLTEYFSKLKLFMSKVMDREYEQARQFVNSKLEGA